MFGYLFKALAIMGIIAAWSDKALADGKVTAEEGFDLLQKLATSLGLPMVFALPDLQLKIAEAPVKEVASSGNAPPPRPGRTR